MKMVTCNARLLFIGGLLLTTILSPVGCKENPAPAASPMSAPIHPREAGAVSTQKRAYLAAVKDYDDFAEHPKGHVYNVHPKDRQVELCYLSAQVVMWTLKVPEFASDLNSDGEVNEWRRWIDIRKYELHC